MKEQKRYRVTIELCTEEITVSARSEAEARKKALARLDRKKASSYISRSWQGNKRNIYADEI